MTVDRVWAVVVTYNGREWVERCLDSLAGAGVAHVVVVDNGSADGTADWVAAHRPGVGLHRLPANVGFGRGNNVGIQLALDSGADAVLLVNQDIVCRPDAVARLVAAAADHRYGILGGFQLTYDGAGIDPAYRGYMPPAFWDDLFLHGATKREVYEVPFAPAAFVLIHRAVLLRVGGFDPLFFLYMEDNDLCDRVRAAGWAVGIVPRAVVLHWHGLFRRKKSLRVRANWAYSELVLAAKRSRRHPAAVLVGRCVDRIRPRNLRAAAGEWVVHLMGFARCVARVPAIARHKGAVPHRFDDRDGRPEGGPS